MTPLALGAYVLRRVLISLALLVLISFFVFSLLYLAPGNSVDILLGLHPRTPETVRLLKEQYHLDEPFLTQYWLWLKEAAQFHFGDSVQTSLPVIDEIKARLPVSLLLGVYAFIVTMVVGVGLGIAAALKRRRLVDRGIVAGAVFGLGTPPFVAGAILLYLFAIVLPWFPTFGRGQGFIDEMWHLTLPAFALALSVGAFMLKHTRAGMIAVLDEDYVTFARARGLSSPRILFAYGLRNALIPVVTIAGVTLAAVIVGAVLVEVTFSLPGIGQLLVQSATTKDLPMLQGVAMVVAVVIMAANLLADLVYTAINPRIQLGRATR
jgi:peptide/nickel transport system permease protein